MQSARDYFLEIGSNGTIGDDFTKKNALHSEQILHSYLLKHEINSAIVYTRAIKQKFQTCHDKSSLFHYFVPFDSLVQQHERVSQHTSVSTYAIVIENAIEFFQAMLEQRIFVTRSRRNTTQST